MLALLCEVTTIAIRSVKSINLSSLSIASSKSERLQTSENPAFACSATDLPINAARRAALEEGLDISRILALDHLASL